MKNNPPQERKERCETCDRYPDEKTVDFLPKCPTCQSTDEEGKATEILEFLRDTQRFVSADIQKSLDSHRDYITKALTQSKLSGLREALELKDISAKGANCGSEHVDQWGEAIKAKINKLEEDSLT